MNPTGPELRDIHLPPAPAWWPPAPGWWLLAIVLAVLAILAARWLLRRLRERRWRRRVLAEFEHIVATYSDTNDRTRLATELSSLLRRIARLTEPQSIALRDADWLDFLDARLPRARDDERPFREGIGRALVDAPWRRAGDSRGDYDAAALIALARRWVVAALPRSSANA